MHFLISGGTGFVGSRLTAELLRRGDSVTVLTRDYAAARRRLGPDVELVRDLEEIDPATAVDALVNLAGAPIADRRWTAARKQELLQSRLRVTRDMIELLQRLEQKPHCLISASAIGFYGAGDDTPLTEESRARSEFSHELCKQWEAEARKAEAQGVRTCIARLGVVLGNGEGMLKKLLLPFRMGLGGRIGSGEQYMSWVHVDDVVAALLFLADNAEHEGAFNVTAPQPVTNEEFTKELAAALKRPRLMPMPAWLVRVMFGEMGDRLLLNGQRVLPARLETAGFTFQEVEVGAALERCV